MEIYTLKTEQDYQRALTDIASLMTAEMDSLEGEHLDTLVSLTEDYERKHYPIDLPTPEGK